MIYPRLFIPNTLKVGQNIIFSKDKAHYIQRVLRLPAQSKVTLFNDQGGEYLAQIHHHGKSVQAQILAFRPIERELPLRITIAQGLATGDKMDWIIEKAVEMGVAALAPIAAQRSTLKLSGTRAARRLEHWQRIIESASAQCGRNRLMQLYPPSSLGDFLDRLPLPTTQNKQTASMKQAEQGVAEQAGTGIILCHQDAHTDFTEALRPPQGGWQDLYLLIGPEGGWSPAEVDKAKAMGARALLFGPRVLRTETAAIALVGAIRGYLQCID